MSNETIHTDNKEAVESTTILLKENKVKVNLQTTSTKTTLKFPKMLKQFSRSSSDKLKRRRRCTDDFHDKY